MPTTIGESLFNHFLKMLEHLPPLPDRVEWLLPFQTEPETAVVFRQFLNKFYEDHLPRTLILGINPGRFGGGITNVAFTDPVHLERACGILNNFPKREELSAQFVYRVVHAFGGVTPFYQHFFINSVVPWGFVKGGRNYNYYDEKPLQKAVEPLAIRHLRGLIGAGMNQEVCFCLGEGKNFAFLSKLNDRESFFKEIISLPHPRFIMQYRRKRVEDFVNLYLAVFKEARSEG
jgi:hypothetical protein